MIHDTLKSCNYDKGMHPESINAVLFCNPPPSEVPSAAGTLPNCASCGLDGSMALCAS